MLAIIQARTSSDRFPKKILTRIYGKTIIEHVVLKVKKSKNIVPAGYNSRQHSNIDSLIEECGYILIRYKNRLNEYCDMYGYSHVF